MNPNFKPQTTPAPLTTPTITRTDARAILDYLHRTRGIGHSTALVEGDALIVAPPPDGGPGTLIANKLPELPDQPVCFDNEVVRQLCLLALQETEREAIRVEVPGDAKVIAVHCSEDLLEHMTFDEWEAAQAEIREEILTAIKEERPAILIVPDTKSRVEVFG